MTLDEFPKGKPRQRPRGYARARAFDRYIKKKQKQRNAKRKKIDFIIYFAGFAVTDAISVSRRGNRDTGSITEWKTSVFIIIMSPRAAKHEQNKQKNKKTFTHECQNVFYLTVSWSSFYYHKFLLFITSGGVLTDWFRTRRVFSQRQRKIKMYSNQFVVANNCLIIKQKLREFQNTFCFMWFFFFFKLIRLSSREKKKFRSELNEKITPLIIIDIPVTNYYSLYVDKKKKKKIRKAEEQPFFSIVFKRGTERERKKSIIALKNAIWSKFVIVY